MKSVKLTSYLFINAFLFLSGIIAILVAIILGGILVQPLLESIGVGLLAASMVNLLDRFFKVEEKKEIAPPPPPAKEEKIILAAYKRCNTPTEILDQKFHAEKVDIVGITLNHAIEDLTKGGGKQIIENLLFHNLQLRLFLVHPNAEYLKQRAIEDKDKHEKLVHRQQEAIKECEVFYKHLLKRYEEEKSKGRLDTRFTGMLQIKLLDFCPYMSIFRINDDRIYWGLYTSGETGLNMPLYLTTSERDPNLYAQLHNHIHGLMDLDTKYPDLVHMTNMDPPEFVQKVYDDAMRGYQP